MSEAKREVWVVHSPAGAPVDVRLTEAEAIGAISNEGETSHCYVPEQSALASAQGEGWIEGSPSVAGCYWIYWRTLRGEQRVEQVNIGPAVFSLTGQLLLKLESGAAFQYEPNRKSISHYQVAARPLPPPPKAEGKP